MSSLNVFLEKYIFPILGAISGALILTNPMNFDWPQRIFSLVALLSIAGLCSYTLTKNAKEKPMAKEEPPAQSTASLNPAAVALQQSSSGANSPNVYAPNSTLNFGAPALDIHQLADLISARLRQDPSIMSIAENPKASVEDRKQARVKAESVIGQDETIQQATRGVPKATVDELQRKALDAAFDDVMKGVAPAVAEARARQEEAEKNAAAWRLGVEQKRLKAEKIKVKQQAEILHGLSVLSRARDVIVETVNHTQVNRLGRKIVVHLNPYPEALTKNLGPSLEVGSILFESGANWKIYLDVSASGDGRFNDPSLSIKKVHSDPLKCGRLVSFHYTFANPAGRKFLPVAFAPPSMIAINEAYESGKISDDAFVEKITLQLLGLREVSEILDRPE